jgi:hypothetical protein
MEKPMNAKLRALGTVFVILVAAALCAEDGHPGLLSTPELKQVVPAVYFFRGQSATVQIRNSSGFRAAGGKLVFAALVDTSGYAHDVAEKYQGLLITEVKISLGGKELPPGAYGFGFVESKGLIVMDVGANDLIMVPTTLDEQLRHPVPLKMEVDGKGYRFYSGRKWVALQPL